MVLEDDVYSPTKLHLSSNLKTKESKRGQTSVQEKGPDIRKTVAH